MESNIQQKRLTLAEGAAKCCIFGLLCTTCGAMSFFFFCALSDTLLLLVLPLPLPPPPLTFSSDFAALFASVGEGFRDGSGGGGFAIGVFSGFDGGGGGAVSWATGEAAWASSPCSSDSSSSSTARACGSAFVSPPGHERETQQKINKKYNISALRARTHTCTHTRTHTLSLSHPHIHTDATHRHTDTQRGEGERDRDIDR